MVPQILKCSQTFIGSLKFGCARIFSYGLFFSKGSFFAKSLLLTIPIFSTLVFAKEKKMLYSFANVCRDHSIPQLNVCHISTVVQFF